MDSREAYSHAVAIYDRFAKAKAEGKSDAEAWGAVGGTIGGAAACTATGAGVAVAGICGTVGGIIGGIIGGAIGGLFGSKIDHTDEVCKVVNAKLDAVWEASEHAGLGLTRQQIQAWFADAANRASLSKQNAWSINGEMGKPGATVTTPRGIVRLNDDGTPHFTSEQRETLYKRNAFGTTLRDRWGTAVVDQRALSAEYWSWLHWNPATSGDCLGGGRWVETDSLEHELSIGLLAVAARFDKRKRGRAMGWVFVLALGTAAFAAWRRREH